MSYSIMLDFSEKPAEEDILAAFAAAGASALPTMYRADWYHVPLPSGLWYSYSVRDQSSTPDHELRPVSNEDERYGITWRPRFTISSTTRSTDFETSRQEMLAIMEWFSVNTKIRLALTMQGEIVSALRVGDKIADLRNSD
jgi:hypothetical protein